MEDVKLVIETANELRTQRARLNAVFEELAEVMAPERVGFTSAGAQSNQRSDKIFDTAPLIAKRGLVNSVGAMLRPKSSAAGKWFDIVPEDPELLEKREVKDWIDFAEERLWRSMYNPRAHFIQSTGEIDDDLVTFGTGVGFVGLRPDQLGIVYRSFHLANAFLEVDGYGQPIAVYVFERLTAKQAARRFGEEKLGRKVREALANQGKHNAEQKFEFIWAVRPRYERDPRSKKNTDMPFASCFVDVASEHMVSEEGFEEMPFFFPRWDTRSGEAYGRGPAVLALPDVLTLNQMGKTLLKGLHRSVDPAWLFPTDSLVSAPKLMPGGISYYDAKALRNIGISNPFIQLEPRGNLPLGLDAQQAAREQIFALFYRNILNLPIAAPQMTATEVIQRREEFVREIGAVFGRLESDYTGPLVERSFNIMMRKGAFGDPRSIPPELQGSNVTFRFASPVEKAKRQIEEATVMQGVAKVLEIGQVQPKIMNRFNWDEIGKFVAESNDFPSKLTLGDDEVQKVNEQSDAAAQREQQMQSLERGSAAARNIAPLIQQRQGAA